MPGDGYPSNEQMPAAATAYWMLRDADGVADPYTSSAKRAVPPAAQASATTMKHARVAPSPAAGPSRLTLPSTPALRAVRPRRSPRQAPPRPDWSEWSDTWDTYAEDDDSPRFDDSGDARAVRMRERTAARPLGLMPVDGAAMPLDAEALTRLPAERAPTLAPLLGIHGANRPLAPRPRAAQATRRVIRKATQPWVVVRAVVAVLMLCLAFQSAAAAAGEPSQPLQAGGYQTAAGSKAAFDPQTASIASKVQPETQGMRPDLYDSYDQFNNWWDAACSAATLSEVLTAYGVPHATIGREIDELGPDISMNGGLLSYHGFERVAALHGMRADTSASLSYAQMLYLTNSLGIPIIVNVRISYGYYHFFSGGHFLVMTGGDDQGLRIVDSSEYYIKYLPRDVFDSMFTGHTVVIVPQDYQYALPS